MSHVGGATCRMTPISWSALEMNPMPGHLFEGNPVGEGTKRRGTDTPTPPGTPACRGTLGGRRKAVRDRFALQGGTGDFP